MTRKYLEDADKLLAEGDLPQASEKYWGAMAEMIKAIAEQKGWRHHSHRELRDVVSQLRRETEDDDIIGLFAIGESLHANFYENWMGQAEVGISSDRARMFV